MRMMVTLQSKHAARAVVIVMVLLKYQPMHQPKTTAMEWYMRVNHLGEFGGIAVA